MNLLFLMQCRNWYRRAIPIAALGLAGIAVIAALLLTHSPEGNLVTYKNKPLDAWFYGSRTNFFYQETRRQAQEAFDAVGTNGGAFLLSKLKRAHGNGVLYWRLYRVLPAWAQSRLTYPISGDDTKAVVLRHLGEMRTLPWEQVQAWADCVPGLRNPRLRMIAFETLRRNHETRPAFLALCRKLMDDEQPGIQLKAAIWLGQYGLVADPGDPRLFPILLAALESDEKRKACADLCWYTYEQQPPGGGCILTTSLR
jgi:hypothetical protein